MDSILKSSEVALHRILRQGTGRALDNYCAFFSDSPACVLQINGQPVGTGPVGSDAKFNIPFTAPGAAGDYTVVTSFTPAGGSAPIGGGSAQLTVSTTGTATVTTAVAPNPSAPNGTVVASGTVTITSGSPAGGTVTVTVRLQSPVLLYTSYCKLKLFACSLRNACTPEPAMPCSCTCPLNGCSLPKRMPPECPSACFCGWAASVKGVREQSRHT